MQTRVYLAVILFTVKETRSFDFEGRPLSYFPRRGNLRERPDHLLIRTSRVRKPVE